MGSLGPFELILIFLAVLLLFGAKRIPEIARGLGKGIKEFKTATKEITDEFKTDDTANRIQPPAQHSQGTAAPREAHPVSTGTQQTDSSSEQVPTTPPGK
jgi:sec-independent protein translocase protein TatA